MNLRENFERHGLTESAAAQAARIDLAVEIEERTRWLHDQDIRDFDGKNALRKLLSSRLAARGVNVAQAVASLRAGGDHDAVAGFDDVVDELRQTEGVWQSDDPQHEAAELLRWEPRPPLIRDARNQAERDAAWARF